MIDAKTAYEKSMLIDTQKKENAHLQFIKENEGLIGILEKHIKNASDNGELGTVVKYDKIGHLMSSDPNYKLKLFRLLSNQGFRSTMSYGDLEIYWNK